jgi:hypothetical protein
MDPKEALNILDQATQPGAQITRIGFVQVQIALETIGKLIEEQTKQNQSPDEVDLTKGETT